MLRRDHRLEGLRRLRLKPIRLCCVTEEADFGEAEDSGPVFYNRHTTPQRLVGTRERNDGVPRSRAVGGDNVSCTESPSRV